jgi:hypothetical protein
MVVVLSCWAIVWGTGCALLKGNPIGRYDIEVEIEDSLRQGSVLVDLVGVNMASLPRWEGYSMSKYWQDNDPMRQDAGMDKVTLSFARGDLTSKMLASTDAIWDTWSSKAVTHVLVLADLPGGHEDKPGTQDDRRQVLPLTRGHWVKKTDTLKVLIKRTGIDIVTSLRPVKD